MASVAAGGGYLTTFLNSVVPSFQSFKNLNSISKQKYRKNVIIDTKTAGTKVQIIV